MAKTVLIVEDDLKIVELLRTYLERDGYCVLTAAEGRTGLKLAEEKPPALVLLDLMLPGLDGLSLCRELRARSAVPVIMITARDEEVDKLLGLEMGADDYITKPFSPREVVARVKAVLRRTGERVQLEENKELVIGEMNIDLAGHRVFKGGQPVDLTPTEFKILTAMAHHPERVFTRAQLLDLVQDYAYEGYERTIDTHMKNLRKKLEDDAKEPRYLQTVFGVGYRFTVNGHA